MLTLPESRLKDPAKGVIGGSSPESTARHEKRVVLMTFETSDLAFALEGLEYSLL